MLKMIRVLQLKEDIPDRFYKVFEPYERVVNHFGKVDIKEYKCVYQGFINKEMSLNDIYAMCNLDRPHGYHGHSLSVSDIVFMDDKYFYCDDIGWRELKCN